MNDNGQKLWLGGNFNSIGRSSGRAAWFDRATGTANLTFPRVNAAQENAVAQYGEQWLIAGDSVNFDGSGNQLGFVRRINPDGCIDTTFQVSTVGPGSGSVRGIAVKGKKIIIVGNFNSVNGVPRMGAAKLIPKARSWLGIPIWTLGRHLLRT
jgi:hypothetical protein